MARFLEAHLATKVLGTEGGTLRMFVLLCRNSNKKPKEKLINWKLGQVAQRLLPEEGGHSLSQGDAVICEFLIRELQAYVARSLPP